MNSADILLEQRRRIRDTLRQETSKSTPDVAEIKALRERDLAIKVCLNALYGCVGGGERYSS